MEALTELCDLIVSNPTLFSDKLSWICSRCPPQPPPSRLTRSHLNAVLTISRFLSKCPSSSLPMNITVFTAARSHALCFLRSILTCAFQLSFWPHNSLPDSISSFFSDFLRYLTVATEISPDFAPEVGSVFGQVLLHALGPRGAGEDSGIVNAFLASAAETGPLVADEDAELLVVRLMEHLRTGKEDAVTMTSSASSENSNSTSTSVNTPSKVKGKEEMDDVSSKVLSAVNRGRLSARSSLDQLTGDGDGGCGGVEVVKPIVVTFEDESVEELQRQVIAFKLLGQVLSKAGVAKLDHIEHIRKVAMKQLKSLPRFLMLRKRDWREQGAALKMRITTKLSGCQAAGELQTKLITFMVSDTKKSKDLLRRMLALLLDAAEACVFSSWRKLKICEELFGTLLVGITQITVICGGQLLRVLLIPLKPLVITTCAQAGMLGNSKNSMFEAITKISCDIIQFGWSTDRALVDTFIMGLASCIRERNDRDEQQDGNENTDIPVVHLNLVRLLADLSVFVNKWEVVDMILPLFIESLEEGEASAPNQLRLRLLDAVSQMASLGFEKSYREAVVLMTRSYLDKLKSVDSAESKTMPPEATTERLETLPAGFRLIASQITSSKLRSDYCHRLLSLCSDIGLAAESKSGRSGADLLGPLLPAVAEICSDIDPNTVVAPALLKLFRNLWFYIVRFGLAPPIQQKQQPSKSVSTVLNSAGSSSAVTLQAITGPYMWDIRWSVAVQHIAQRTPPLVIANSVKWLEDESDLNSLHNPASRRGTGNEKVVLSQRTALSTALSGRVDVAAMSSISGVKATYLLAVVFLEIIRFSRNGGAVVGVSDSLTYKSSFNCVFEYLRTPTLTPVDFQCLTAVVHKAFETAVSWLEDRMTETGKEADTRESVLSCHACFLIESMSQREDHIREISVTLLTQLKDKFPQILWNSSCFNTLLFSVHKGLPSSMVNDPAWVASVRSLYQKFIREWISNALSYAPCTSQGLLQEMLCHLNSLQRPQHATDVISLLSEVQICTGKNDCWSGIRTANIPYVIASAAAASGGNLEVNGPHNFEVLSTAIVSATLKCNYVGEISGMTRLYNSIGGFQSSPLSIGIGPGSNQGLGNLSSCEPSSNKEPLNEILLAKFVQQLQEIVGAAERDELIDKVKFRELCSQATALLLSNMACESKLDIEGSSQLLRLLCWCPAYISTPDAMETGIFIWTWLVSSAPHLGPLVLAELVDAWLWTIDRRRGLFTSDIRFSGPAAKLRPHLIPGEPDSEPEKNVVDGIIAHRLWLGFLIDRFEVVRHDSVEQLMLLGRMLQGTMKSPFHFSRHPAVTGTFFTLMLFGLKFCSCQFQRNLKNCKMGLRLLEDRVYRASLGWFAYMYEWYEAENKFSAQCEAQSVSIFVNHLINESMEVPAADSSLKERGIEKETTPMSHPIWGRMDNYAADREKRKRLLLMLCQHETDRLDVWAQPLNTKENAIRSKISPEKWTEYVRTAFNVDPRIALSMSYRFPTISVVTSEIVHLVQKNVLDIRDIPEALPFFITPKAVDENSVLLQQLPHWASCSITQALEFLTPPYKGHPRVMAYVLRVLESYPPDRVTFFMPQLIQSLRYDDEKLVEGYLLRAAQRSNIFAHILIWHLQGETCTEDSENDPNTNSFQAILPIIRQKIIDGFSSWDHDIFEREFNFFDKVTSISGALYRLPKEERRAGIKRELEKISVDCDDLYLPTATNKLVRGIQVDSGIPLQSAAKVPIMITFDVVDRHGDPNDLKPQACIFKVGDDCRQDVLALQVISLLRDIFEANGLNLYLFPYGVLPTGPERGIIEVVPNTRSRNQMGEVTDGGLYEIFQQDFGAVGSTSFETAREMFIISSAGYAVASLLLQPKDRHNGNLLFDNLGRLVHIDFGFILETSPGGNLRFERAHFKLSHEMTQLLDPSGSMKSETWSQFVSLCVKGYLAARRHMHSIITTVLLMVDSGLPCFSRGDPIGRLRKRFHPEMTDREAANFMIKTCMDAYDKWSTAGYDFIQYWQQGIEK